jgi:predicted esterase
LGLNSLFAWLISHQPAVLFSHNKSAISNQPTVLFSQNKPAPVISHQPTEHAESFLADEGKKSAYYT